MPCLNLFINISAPITLVLLLLAQNGFANAALQKNALSKEQSSNQISPKGEVKAKVDEQLYYLPLQTVFGETHTLAAGGSVSTTSPPHISIQPAPTQKSHQENTRILDAEILAVDHNAATQCVSETPMIELKSGFLLPSTEAVKESVIMSGHLEIASKTSSFEEATEDVSKPSVVLQGTEFHSHTIADL